MTAIDLQSTGTLAGSDRRSWTTSGRSFLRNSWAILLVILVWQLWVSLSGVNEIVLPSPARVLADVVTNPGAFAGDAAWTVGRSLAGLTLGMGSGFLLALLASSSALISGLVTPPAMIMRAVPVVAMIPVIARVAGYGDSAVLVVTTIISFFPTFVLTVSGVRRLLPGTSDLFALAGSTKRDRLVRLMIPSAVPNLLVALRLSAPSSVLAAMIAEFLIGRNGLGELFSQARTDMEMPRAWGAALIATFISVAFFSIAAVVERRGNAKFRP